MGGKARPTSPQNYAQARAWEDLDRQGEDLRILASRFVPAGEASKEIQGMISQVISRIKLAVVAGG